MNSKEYIRQLADDLSDEYDNANPGDVEDAMSVCVWVEHLTGEELTLEEAEDLRTALETNQHARTAKDLE